MSDIGRQSPGGAKPDDPENRVIERHARMRELSEQSWPEFFKDLAKRFAFWIVIVALVWGVLWLIFR